LTAKRTVGFVTYELGTDQMGKNPKEGGDTKIPVYGHLMCIKQDVSNVKAMVKQG